MKVHKSFVGRSIALLYGRFLLVGVVLDLHVKSALSDILSPLLFLY